jgi:RND family efflux transporter MFP subunit
MRDTDAPHAERPITDDRPMDDQTAWHEFRQATTTGSFCRGWLGILCRRIPGVEAAAIFGSPASSGPTTLSLLASWGGATRDPKPLAEVAHRAVSAGHTVVAVHRPPPDGTVLDRYLVAYPARASGRVTAAVALDVALSSKAELRALLRQLEWGSGWLEAVANRRTAADQVRDRLGDVLETVASALGHERFTAAATAFVTTLAAKLGCDRVSLGFVRGARVRVRAMSHTAHVDDRTNLLRAIGAAMGEAIDQKGPVVYPPRERSAAFVSRAQQELGGAILTVPFAAGTRLVGALTLERPLARPFDDVALELVQAVAGVAGPMLEALRRDDRWLARKALDAGRQQLARLVGPRHTGLKLGAAAVVAAIAVLVLATGEYRVTARAVMEADVRRLVVAPFNGYIREAAARAGDVVQKGQLLTALDDRELRLERARWSSQHEQLTAQQRHALAARNAAQTAISAAQLDQARAQLALIDEQLAKSRIVAGVDGVVVSGDLSQSLGSPVDKGQVLFHLAPLDAYRVVLEVDERDVSDVAVGQRGQLLLAAAPDTPMAFSVERITPVSTARDGRNYFRVEAALDRTPDRLRPGMEGSGKITVDSRRLVRIWLRSLVDWVRLALWTWTP